MIQSEEIESCLLYFRFLFYFMEIADSTEIAYFANFTVLQVSWILQVLRILRIVFRLSRYHGGMWP